MSRWQTAITRAKQFDPRSVPGLALWLDASASSSLTLNGSTASEWRDMSGNGRHFAQETGANQPNATNRTQNGRRVLDFDGNDQLLGNNATLGILQNVQGGTVIAVAAYDVLTSTSISPTMFIVSSGANQNQSRLALASVSPSTGTIGVGGRRLDANSFQSVSANYSAATSAVISGVLDYANSNAFLYVHGRLAASTTAFQTDGNTSDTGSVAAAVGSGVNLNYFDGFIGELLVWPRVLAGMERERVENYLAAKWGIALAPKVSNADAQDWIHRVYSNGGQVSSATASAVNTLCNSIDAAGIRDRFYRLGIFAGSNLAAALVPLYRGPSLGGTQFGNATDTNFNFVSGDYQELGSSGGLKGTGNNGVGAGNTKHLRTGLQQSTLATSNLHLSAFVFGLNSTSATQQGFLGIRNNTIPTNRWWFSYRQTSILTDSGASTGFSISPPSGNALITVSRESSTLKRGYVNGTQSGSDYTTDVSASLANRANDWYVFASNIDGSPGEYCGFRIGMYSIGLSLTPAGVSAISSAVAAFNAAMGRT